MWIQKAATTGIQVLTYAPDGRTLYVMDRGGWITAWDVSERTRRRLFRLTGSERPNTVAIAATADGGHLVVWTDELQVWDLSAGAVRVELPPDFAWQDARLHPDGRQLVTHSGDALTTWDIPRREHGLKPLAKVSKNAWLDGFAISPGGTAFIVEQVPPQNDTWLIAGGRRRRFPEWDGWLGSMRLTADGRTLVLHGRGTDELLLWDVPSRTTRGHARCWPFRGGPVMHPAAPILAGRDKNGMLKLLNLETGEPLRTLDFRLGQYVECAAFSPDGLTCAIGGSNKQFAVFDLDL